MNLVFLNSNDIKKATPYTTTEVIAEYARIDIDSVKRLIRNHKADLEEFGILRFEIRKLGGRGRPTKEYLLNEQQATLLITYLENTEPVRAFKKALVRAFFQMRQELEQTRLERAKQVPTRRELTDVIKEKQLDKWAYSRYNDLAYIKALGNTAKKIRQSRGATATAIAADFLTAEENKSVTEVTNKIAVLLDCGLDYQTIKQML